MPCDSIISLLSYILFITLRQKSLWISLFVLVFSSKYSLEIFQCIALCFDLVKPLLSGFIPYDVYENIFSSCSFVA